MRSILLASAATLVLATSGMVAVAAGPKVGPGPAKHSAKTVVAHQPSHGHTAGSFGHGKGSSHGHPVGGFNHHNGSHHWGTKSFHYHGHNYNFRYYHRHYRGWSSYCWLPSYHCYGYFCPEDSCWYYWYAPYNCYIPIQYVRTFAPTPLNVNVNVNNNVNTNTSAAGFPALPQGAVPVSPGAVPPLPGAE